MVSEVARTQITIENEHTPWKRAYTCHVTTNEHTVGIHNEHCSFPYDMCQRYYVFTMYIACDIIIWRHTNYLDLNDTYLENEHPYLKRSIHLSPHYENEHTQNFITNISAFSIPIWVLASERIVLCNSRLRNKVSLVEINLLLKTVFPILKSMSWST